MKKIILIVTCFVSITTIAQNLTNLGNTFTAAGSVGSNSAHDFSIETSGINRITVKADGKVGIGSVVFPASSAYRLFVEGNIACRELKVQATGWPDYVFAKEYKLLSIAELEAFIRAHKHLPNIPGADEVAKNEGVEVGNMQKLLLQKIEEQTLYIIDLQHQIDELKKRIP